MENNVPSAVEKQSNGASPSPQSKWITGALVIAVFVAIWSLLRPPLHERLYTEYGVYPKAELLLRGGGDVTAPDMKPVADAFNRGEYQNALDQLVLYLPNYPHDIEARLLIGLCYLELNKNEDARGAFQQIIRKPNAWSSEASWFLALSYLRENRRIECIRALGGIREDSDRYPQALELWEKIK
jgi:tetratricopeptide (TPR) repeat protein